MVGAKSLEEIAHAFIKALETLDLDEMIRLRSPDCVQKIYPKSMGYPGMDNARSVKGLSLPLIPTSVRDPWGLTFWYSQKLPCCIRSRTPLFR